MSRDFHQVLNKNYLVVISKGNSYGKTFIVSWSFVFKTFPTDVRDSVRMHLYLTRLMCPRSEWTVSSFLCFIGYIISDKNIPSISDSVTKLDVSVVGLKQAL